MREEKPAVELTVDDIEAFAKAFLASPARPLPGGWETVRMARIIVGLCPIVRQVYGSDPVLQEKR